MPTVEPWTEEQLRHFRPQSQSYIPDFRPSPRITRAFDGGSEPVDLNARTLALIVNLALSVGRGTEPMKALTDIVAPLGVRRNP